ncbi:MAG: hypothetical protein UT43_C0017G0015 [Parcubacteria group bacterium GW2011_GWC1_39_29]|uniref:Uncharacterized protein n=1 Tax=Candidatus Yanofskybacteria bacterium GW2011_GWD1_39_16 TaxID=1619030 RepID=A0A837HQV9_9BACT|nr:MAG: hypothetical protein UT35_C0002G0014 [Candidatus Yanofskybacteria bacterium GW2011_GWD1_39_16]KKR14744.1 MAG: hypothetical protein UT43_C0017G0015 [Parcubacteria group bacterium GW2011_GWC1_39_29]
MNNIEKLKFYQEIKILFLDVIKVGLKYFKNPEIKKTTESIIEQYKTFNEKFLC